jgi:hypothetical protein
MTQERPNVYEKMRKEIQQSGVCVISDISASGEGIAGISNLHAIFQTMRHQIARDALHLYSYRCLNGSSIGSVTINFILKILYIYELNGKHEAMALLDILITSLNDSAVRKILYNAVGQDDVSLRNMHYVFLNFLETGALFKYNRLISVLNCEPMESASYAERFKTQHYFDWLDKRLENVFISTVSIDSSRVYVYTGNKQTSKFKSQLVTYVKLTHENFIHACCCSASLPVIFERLYTNNERCLDGSALHINNINLIHLIHNASYFTTIEQTYHDLLEYIDSHEKNITIHVDKFNYQSEFENIDKYNNFGYNLISLLVNYAPRVVSTSRRNINILSIYQNQPHLPQFSTSDLTKIDERLYTEMSREALQLKLLTLNSQLNIPNEYITNKEFKNCGWYKKIWSSHIDYMRLYEHYKSCMRLNPISSYLYDIRTEDYEDKKIHLITTDIFVRRLYPINPLVDLVSIFIGGNDVTRIQRQIGVIQGNAIFNILQKKQWFVYEGDIKKGMFDYKSILDDICSKFTQTHKR